MKIGIVGIGGVGGYLGGKLARKYGQSGKHDIIFIARGEHLSAIKKNGLKLFTKEGDYVVKPTLATDNPAEAGIFDLVFFGVKSYSLMSSAKQVIGNITKDTVMIPLLNGVDIADRLQSILPDAKILPGCVYTNHNGSDYLCKSIPDDNSAVMERVKDGWTLIAHGIQKYGDGTIEWDYSTGGHWTH